MRFLRQEIFRLGWPANFQIIDEQDAKVLAKHVMQELGLDRTKATVRKFLAAIGLAKGQQRQHYVGRYMLPGSKDVEGSDEFSRYLKVQLKHFVLDYDDRRVPAVRLRLSVVGGDDAGHGRYHRRPHRGPRRRWYDCVRTTKLKSPINTTME